MKTTIKLICSAFTLFALVSCGIITGAGGTNTGVSVNATGRSANYYDLVPVGDRVTYTIDIST